MTDYFTSDAIGSSLLADCIVSVDPLVVCTDRAIKERKPTAAMEIGRLFEDLVETEYGDLYFLDKYFQSNFQTMPSGILDILEAENIEEAVDNGYVYKATKGKEHELHGTYKRKHAMLDQIKAHDYRRPVPVTWWDTLGAMFENFKKYPFTLSWKKEHGIADQTETLAGWMKDWAEVRFQVEYFWEETGAKCRAKFDMIWLIEYGDETYAVPFDLKATGDAVDGNKSFGAFVGNWKRSYIWQSAHYMAGIRHWCEENGYIPHDRIYYIVQESTAPQVTNVWSLHPDELKALDAARLEALPIIQKWIDEGKPIRGYMPQQTVNRYGREWRNYE